MSQSCMLSFPHISSHILLTYMRGSWFYVVIGIFKEFKGSTFWCSSSLILISVHFVFISQMYSLLDLSQVAATVSHTSPPPHPSLISSPPSDSLYNVLTPSQIMCVCSSECMFRLTGYLQLGALFPLVLFISGADSTLTVGSEYQQKRLLQSIKITRSGNA